MNKHLQATDETQARLVSEELALSSVSMSGISSDSSPDTSQSFRKQQQSKSWQLMISSVIMLLSATFNTIATKHVNHQRLPPCLDCPPMYFEAPILQTWIGFVGQSVFLPVAIWTRRSKSESPKSSMASKKSDLKPCPAWLWLFPLLCDFASSACLNYATVLIQASTVQMLRSFNIVMTFFLTLCLIRSQFYVHQILGVGYTFLGMTVVGISAWLHPDSLNNQQGSLQFVGFTAAILGTVFTSVQWVVEEVIFRHYTCSPLESAGWMGVFGTIVGFFTLILVYVANWEDLPGALYQITSLSRKEGITLLVFNFFYVVSVGINTASGLFITKLGSSLLRTIINSARIASVWCMELFLGWTSFFPLHILGLILILAAMLVYNLEAFPQKYRAFLSCYVLEGFMSKMIRWKSPSCFAAAKQFKAESEYAMTAIPSESTLVTMGTELPVNMQLSQK